MNRKEFIKMCSLLGVGLPLLEACGMNKKAPLLGQSDKVVIIGAGAAGLTAAHLLTQQGIEVEILEASTLYGGRMKRTTEFADFPIPTGAEWLHTQKSILDEIVNDPDTPININTTPYNYELDHALVEGKKVNLKEVGFTIDQKFINATWFDFFEQYVVPNIKDNIRFNKEVKAIDYTSDEIVVHTNEEVYQATRVIVTVPVKILQLDRIQFTPQLPEGKQTAIKNVTVWDGCKAFMAFSKKFYPSVTGFEIKPETAGHKLFYDAAYGQNTAQNILGLFAVGDVAAPYLERNEAERIDYILNELDQLFAGQASENYQKYIFQNWATAPFAQGAYVHYFADRRAIRTLGQSVADKLYFAGDAYTDGNDWSSVHAAAQSAMKAVEALIG